MTNTASEQKYRRKLRNFLLQPLLQIKLGLFSIILAVLFCVSIVGILYVHMAQVYIMVLQLTDLEEEAKSMVESYLSDTTLSIASASLVFIFFNIVISVLYTHRLVGPTIAFRRHIQRLIDGDYKAKTILRKHDAFPEVADDLNRLSDTLAKK